MIDFPFNGNGVAEAGGEAKDALYIKAKQVQSQLHWCSHTWSHLDLTLNDQADEEYPTTYQEAYDEMVKNQAFALDFFGGPTSPVYSDKYMVTPGISGLFNPNAIKAILDAGTRT